MKVSYLVSMGNNSLSNPVLRVSSVLECFSLKSPRLSAADVQKRIGISWATLHRILFTLKERGLLEYDDKTNTYTIGPILYSLGTLYLNTTDLVSTANPVVETISEITTEVVSIGILSKENMIIVLRVESPLSIRWSLHVGSSQPAYATALGKALLSELTEKEIDGLFPGENLYPLTGKTITSKTALKKDLQQINNSGIAFSNEETQEGVIGIASLIRNASGKAVAAMSIGTMIYTLDNKKRARLISMTRMGAALISLRLGFQAADNPIRSIEELHSRWEKL